MVGLLEFQNNNNRKHSGSVFCQSNRMSVLQKTFHIRKSTYSINQCAWIRSLATSVPKPPPPTPTPEIETFSATSRPRPYAAKHPPFRELPKLQVTCSKILITMLYNDVFPREDGLWCWRPRLSVLRGGVCSWQSSRTKKSFQVQSLSRSCGRSGRMIN